MSSRAVAIEFFGGGEFGILVRHFSFLIGALKRVLHIFSEMAQNHD